MKTTNGKYDILIIEDNEELAGLIQLLLLQNGFRAEFITDSAKAFDKVRKEKPAVVILDLVMPAIDGLRLCRKIKSTRETANTKVIIYTGKNYESDRRKAFNLGADAFMVKPTRAHLLLRKVKELLEPTYEPVY
jgi:DNA-binding response OmpR family regulator